MRNLLTLVLLIVVAFTLVGCMWPDEAAARRAETEAERMYAQRSLVEAESQAEVRAIEAQSQAWQEKYMLWTTSLVMFLDSGQLLIAGLSALLGFIGGLLLVRWLAAWIWSE